MWPIPFHLAATSIALTSFRKYRSDSNAIGAIYSVRLPAGRRGVRSSFEYSFDSKVLRFLSRETLFKVHCSIEPLGNTQKRKQDYQRIFISLFCSNFGRRIFSRKTKSAGPNLGKETVFNWKLQLKNFPPKVGHWKTFKFKI